MRHFLLQAGAKIVRLGGKGCLGPEMGVALHDPCLGAFLLSGGLAWRQRWVSYAEKGT